MLYFDVNKIYKILLLNVEILFIIGINFLVKVKNTSEIEVSAVIF